MTNGEIIQILQEIHDDCKEKQNCFGCQYGYTNNAQIYCAISSPDSWELEKICGKESE